MKLIVILALFLPVFAFIPGNAGALEVSDGKIKLVLHEDIGRFSLYYLVNPDKKKYVSLLVDQDIRTSFLSLIVDDKVYRMGETSQFKEKIEKKDSGALRTWESDWLIVSEEFRFIASGREGTDGIKIVLSIKNKSPDKTTVGVRYLFDTYLGERSGAHFTTDKLDKMDNETSFEKANMIQYWISPQEPPKEPVKVGLKMPCLGNGVTTPDKIVFANWKRLSDSLWSYAPAAGRNFSVRPYSINDSAVSVYYDPETLGKGSNMDIVLSLTYYGTNAAEGTPVPSGDNKSSASEDARNEAQREMLDILSSKEKKDTMRKNFAVSKDNLKIVDDLSTIENLIDEINKILFSGDEISEKDMKLMEQMIAELSERVKKY